MVHYYLLVNILGYNKQEFKMMFYFSMFMQSLRDWVLFFISSMLIGMSKTGIQGISLLAIPLASCRACDGKG